MPTPGPYPDAPLTGANASIDSQSLKVIVWICYSVALLFVCARLGVRFSANRQFLFDDYAIIFASLSLLTLCILQTIQEPSLFFTIQVQVGRITPGPEDYPLMVDLERWQFPLIKLFWVTLWSVKASFLFIIYRLVWTSPVRLRIWYGIVVFTALAFIGCVISSVLTCSPPSDYFKPGKCETDADHWRSKFNVIFTTCVDVTSDLLIAVLPMTLLPSLQLDARRKAGLGVVFLLGLLIVGVAIARMTQVILVKPVDLVGLAVWSVVEASVAVIVGSLPPLKSIVARGIKYASQKSSDKLATGSKANNYLEGSNIGHNSSTVNARPTRSIPLDDMHPVEQQRGGIFIQKSFTTTLDEMDASSREDDDERSIIKHYP